MKCFAAILLASSLYAADFRAGVARADITPGEPLRQSGYASRTHPAEGTADRLAAKALALDDGKNGRLVILTLDLIGLPRSVADVVSARAQKNQGLERHQLLFNSSHTHAGPVVPPNLSTMFDYQPGEEDRLRAYTQTLTDQLSRLVADSLADLQPARLAFGQGEAGFAINRRQPSPTGIKLGVNPQGPVDRSVPVLQVTAPDGRLRAVLFGYACHNTTLGGDFYRYSADYAGYAQAALEAAHPGATALFVMLCGADQNPEPRGTLALAEQHGKALAVAVDKVLQGTLKPVRPPLRAALQMTELRFAPHTRETFETEAKDPNPAKVRRANAMLRLYDGRHAPRTLSYPVQAVQFGKDLTLVALGGEVVVDYALRLKKEHPGRPLMALGYSNDVPCYIPSRRVLQEGGYEPVISTMYYGTPGPFAEDVEELIFTAINQVWKRVHAP